MNKPTMKRTVAVTNEFDSQGIVYFFANECIAAQAADFGKLSDAGQPDKYQMQIDPRYDFDDVVAWLKSFNG